MPNPPPAAADKGQAKQPYVHVGANFTLTVRATPDRMKLFLDAESTAPVELKREALLELISPYAPTDEVSLAVIDEVVGLLKRGEAAKERRIKRGKDPVSGADGKLVLLIKPFTGRGEVQVDEKGFARSHDMHLFDNIRKGQSIARVYPAKQGVVGKDVFGCELPAQSGQDFTLKLDPSCVLQSSKGDTFQVVVAQIDGYAALLDGGKSLKVEPELVVSGDLDSRLGSLDFIGLIKITGDVNPGLLVHGRLGVTVLGGVTGSVIKSSEGPVRIEKFLVGAGRGELIARTDISIGIAQNAKISAVGSINIETEARDCKLNCEASVMMPKADLIGGEVHCVCGVEARRVGSVAEAPTKIFLETNVETTGEFAVLKRAVEEHERGLALLDLHLGPYAKNPSRVQLLKEPHRSKIEQLLQKRQSLDHSRIQILAKRKSLLESGHVSAAARVNVYEAFFPGAVVQAGEAIFRPLESVKGPASITYSSEKKLFEVGEMVPVTCEFEKKDNPEGQQHEQKK